MLVMRRRKGESILIGDGVEIFIISIGRSKVKIGINAPRNLRVVMREVELVAKENEAAAQSCADLLEPAIARILRQAGKPAQGAEKKD
ncbi:MAG: carbon storage regulator [Acidobacteria bacterium]|nr:carbon storage regulator [Acidobacteriota bacterium]